MVIVVFAMLMIGLIIHGISGELCYWMIYMKGHVIVNIKRTNRKSGGRKLNQ